ncbi:pirin family protein [Flavobacterium geliluteum]|uniref:Pirin family protein n=1 Tax=Flavobacterium geliluteum TaxID=2816120 RepID=A0A941B3C8_9FLAO|nr:pirin family protein [Flavobacterium geliluteum]MBP4138373.1 pirin family protein [Flavobacterium geliluteum]
MSNIKLIIEERAADVGNFIVGRLLPFRKKRMVGPFIFIDHMGPVTLDPYENMDVDMHPHIGLSTLTFLFEGNVLHRDSLGTVREIKSGEVNWMTAGKGVVHSERTPDYLRDKVKTLHGLQIWVALPKEDEECEPSFTHIDANLLPSWKKDSVSFKLIAGEAFGKKSPVPVYSPLYFVEIKSSETKMINIGSQLYGESGIYILEGAIKSDGHSYGPKQILVAKDNSLCEFQIEANTILYIFGGEPFPEERFIEWNFVATSKTLIEKAKENWVQDKFPIVPNQTVKVPLPSPRQKN